MAGWLDECMMQLSPPSGGDLQPLCPSSSGGHESLVLSFTNMFPGFPTMGLYVTNVHTPTPQSQPLPLQLSSPVSVGHPPDIWTTRSCPTAWGQLVTVLCPSSGHVPCHPFLFPLCPVHPVSPNVPWLGLSVPSSVPEFYSEFGLYLAPLRTSTAGIKDLPAHGEVAGRPEGSLLGAQALLHPQPCAPGCVQSPP